MRFVCAARAPSERRAFHVAQAEEHPRNVAAMLDRLHVDVTTALALVPHDEYLAAQRERQEAEAEAGAEEAEGDGEAAKGE